MISYGANNWNLGLYDACRAGHLKMAYLMISLGATNWNDGLSAACKYEHRKLVKLMISKGANFCHRCDEPPDIHL